MLSINLVQTAKGHAPGSEVEWGTGEAEGEVTVPEVLSSSIGTGFCSPQTTVDDRRPA